MDALIRNYKKLFRWRFSKNHALVYIPCKKQFVLQRGLGESSNYEWLTISETRKLYKILGIMLKNLVGKED